MAEDGRPNISIVTATQAEHDGDTVATKKVSTYAYDINGTLKKRLTGTPAGTHFPLDVAIVDGSGNQITSFGGGTQYTEGDTDASITGTALMLEGAANALVAAVGGAGAVSTAVQRVTLGSDDPAVTSLGLLDNSVDGNYLNVNVNMAGTDAATGAGAVNAQTQRVTHASNDPVTTSVQLIDDTVFTDDTSTHSTGSTKGIGIMAAATPTDTSVNANDIGMVAMSTDRKLYSQAYIVSGGVASGAFASGSIATGAIVDALADDAAFTPAISRVFPSGFFADETSTDSVNEGDIGAARMTLDRRQIIASENNDDAAWTASGKVSAAGYVFDDASIDVLDEGDVGYARVDSQRRQYVNVGGGIPVFGQNTSTSTSEVQISSTSVIIQTIRITALSSNTEPIYIGLTGLTTSASSTELLPGDVVELHGSFNLNTLYFRKATAVSGGVSFVYQP